MYYMSLVKTKTLLTTTNYDLQDAEQYLVLNYHSNTRSNIFDFPVYRTALIGCGSKILN